MSSEQLFNQDIIIVGQQAWDTEIGSNCKNIAVEMAKHHRVLYVNSPLKRKALLKKEKDDSTKKRISIIQNKETNIFEVEPNLYTLYPDTILESVNFLPDNFIFDVINKINNKRFAKAIQKAIKALDFKDFVLFNDNDIYDSFYLKDYLKPKISIYYSRDFMLGTDFWRRHGNRLEPLLISKSDLAVANSVYLANYCKQYNEKAFYVGQGCDFELFTNPDLLYHPKDIPSQKPIIGYVGNLSSLRLDLDIIEHIATGKPEWNIVLVGPMDHDFQQSKLHRIPNVFFLGQKAIKELPGYINSFDVCINPQKLNKVTIGNYPRKIDEYLALGKPVVATQTEAMETFSDYVYLAQDKTEYIQYINQALNENDINIKKQRINFALSHTWENSVIEIYKAINQVITS
ncbi:glycosyltransferase [Pedobacter glucosidilyticus]|uniref:glycosyltransferase n=1 Tax=Pedobacter glucosidilyticus TaxID=1122941 RepID=UPI00041A89D8|nr:glycosyltransferase [Pedobacter glucosidilyticus]